MSAIHSSKTERISQFKLKSGATLYSTANLEVLLRGNFAPALSRSQNGEAILTPSVNCSDLWQNTSSTLTKVNTSLGCDLTSIVAELLKKQSSATILDWGCGDGTALNELYS